MLAALPAAAARGDDNPYHCTWCLFEVRIDGSGFRRLPIPDAWEVVDLSPDRTRMIVRDGETLYVAPLGRRSRHALARGVSADAAFSPDGRKVAFTSDWLRPLPPPPGCIPTDVWVVGIDGKGLRQVSGRCAEGPSWAPDSKRLAFVHHLGGGSGVVEIADLRGHRRPVGLVEDGGVTWAPRGNLLAEGTVSEPAQPNDIGGYTGGPAGDPPHELRIVRFDGHALRAFPHSFGPVWSRDGKRIAFARDDKPYRDVPVSLGTFYDFTLRIAPMDGGPETGYANCFASAWSPDSASIACEALQSGTIYAVSAAAGSFRPVITLAEGGEIHNVWWSANGDRLLIAWEFTNFE